MKGGLATVLLVGAVVALVYGRRDLGVALILSAFCMAILALLPKR